MFSTYSLKTHKLIVEGDKENFQCQGSDILADNQAKFLLSQPTLTHLDASGNTPSERYSKNNQTGYVAANLFIIVGTLMHVRLL
jgi:hypothetical protein